MITKDSEGVYHEVLWMVQEVGLTIIGFRCYYRVSGKSLSVAEGPITLAAKRSPEDTKACRKCFGEIPRCKCGEVTHTIVMGGASDWTRPAICEIHPK